MKIFLNANKKNSIDNDKIFKKSSLVSLANVHKLLFHCYLIHHFITKEVHFSKNAFIHI